MTKPSTADRMRARKASVHIFPTTQAVGQIPFPGHRNLSEIGNKNDMADRRRRLAA